MKQRFETTVGKRMGVETAFKKPEHPFRVAIVCAMWFTGFDVECLSTVLPTEAEFVRFEDEFCFSWQYPVGPKLGGKIKSPRTSMPKSEHELLLSLCAPRRLHERINFCTDR
jgi:hypothetical protein